MVTGSTQCIGDEVAQKLTDLAFRVHHAAEIDPQKEPLDAVLESTTPDWSFPAPEALHGRSGATVQQFLDDRVGANFFRAHSDTVASFP